MPTVHLFFSLHTLAENMDGNLWACQYVYNKFHLFMANVANRL